MTTSVSVDASDRGLDAMFDAADGGYADIYTAPQPATPDTAITTQTKLARLAMNSPAFAAAAAGLKAARTITAGVGLDTGPATWFRLLETDGTTAISDGTAGIAGSGPGGTDPTMVLDSADIQVGAVVQCDSMVYSIVPA